jgi:hypothetical protein
VVEQPLEQIVDAVLCVEVLHQWNEVGSVKTRIEDEQQPDAVEDLPASEGLVGDVDLSQRILGDVRISVLDRRM